MGRRRRERGKGMGVAGGDAQIPSRGTAFRRERTGGGENGERKEEGVGGEDIVFFLSRFLYTTSHFFII